MYCSKCGHNNLVGAAFCASCGAPFKKDGQANQANQGNQGNSGYAQAGNTSYAQTGNSGYSQTGNFGYAQTGGIGRPPMAPIRKRNIVLCIVLSIVTCGIYGLYWVCCIANDVNEASDHRTDTSGGMVIVFSIITCGIYMIYWAYVTGGKVSEIKQRYEGKADDGLKILYLILVIFGLAIIQYALVQNELNKIAAHE